MVKLPEGEQGLCLWRAWQASNLLDSLTDKAYANGYVGEDSDFRPAKAILKDLKICLGASQAGEKLTAAINELDLADQSRPIGAVTHDIIEGAARDMKTHLSSARTITQEALKLAVEEGLTGYYAGYERREPDG